MVWWLWIQNACRRWPRKKTELPLAKSRQLGD
jgi:hypothetical protein